MMTFKKLGLALVALLMCVPVLAANPIDPPATQPGQSLAQLPDGHWMLAGGAQAGRQILMVDPVTSQATVAQLSLSRSRSGHTATVMPDGRILVVGGLDDAGLPIVEVEVIDFGAGTTFVADLGLLARAYHTATLLSDGRILITGGIDARGRPLSEAELLETAYLQSEAFNGRLERARWQHLSQLLPSDKVLLFGGKGADGQTVPYAELYDAATQRISAAPPQVQEMYQSLNGAQPPTVAASTPADGAWDVTPDSRIVVHLSKWMQPASLNQQTVRLACGGKDVNAGVVPAERGLLLFISPRQSLGTGIECKVTIDGAQDAMGAALDRTEIKFRTRAPAKPQATPPASTPSVSLISSPVGTASPGASASKAQTEQKGNAFPVKTTDAPGPDLAAQQAGGQAAAESADDKSDVVFRLPMLFEQNRGQHDDKIKFSARGRGYRLHVADTETLFDVAIIEQKKDKAVGKASGQPSSGLISTMVEGQRLRFANEKAAQRDDAVVTQRRVRLQLVGANPKAGIVGLEPQESKTHYLDAARPERKSADVPHYGKLLQAAVYPGIDKLYYGREGHLEYDWIIKPGANPGQIAQKIDGADALSVASNGDLLISVAGKHITQKKPVAFQTIDDKKVPVAADYVIAGNVVKIHLGDYDKTKPLTIDPVIEFTTNIDGLLTQNNSGLVDMQIANDGSVFMLAMGSARYPTTGAVTLPGPKTLQNADNYLIKLRPGGQTVEYVTVFVNYSAYSVGYEKPYGAMAVVDSVGGPQAVLTGWNVDLNNASHPIVSKLAPTGDAYAFSRMVDGAGGGALAVDASGAIYVTGWSVNGALGGTVNSFWPVVQGYPPNYGCSLIKLSPDGAVVQFQSVVRLPSCSRPMVKVDGTGSAYLVAYSSGQITPSNALIPGTVTPQNDGNGGLTYSAYPFTVKFSPGGDAIQYATYLFTDQNGSIVPFLNVADIGLDATGSLYALGGWHAIGGSVVTKYSPVGAFGFATAYVPPRPDGNIGCNDSCINFASLAVAPTGETYAGISYFNPFLFNGTNVLRVSTVVAKRDAAGAVNGEPAFLNGFPNGFRIGQAVRLDANAGVYVSGASGSLAGNSPTLFLSRLAYGTLLRSTPNPSGPGETVTLNLVNLGPAATGWASFYDGGVFLGSAPVNNGAVSYQVATLTAGAHLLSASFNGGNFTASHQVRQNNYAASTTLTGPATVSENDQLTLQVQVTSGGNVTPTGAVAIREGVITRATGVLNGAGAATIVLPIQPKGTHQYVAAYQGDANHAASNSIGLLTTVTEVPVTVAIGAPMPGATLSVPAPIPVGVTLAMGAQTTIKSVSYTANGAPIGQANSAPFGIAWQLAVAGDYSLVATATSDSGATYTSAPVNVTAVAQPGAGLVTYFHQDLSGNTIAATDAAGNVAYTEQYRPYGDRIVNDPNSKLGQLSGNRIWFHGKAQDEATGLQYFGARYYDPVVGRFMGVDAAGVDPGNVHSYNRYAYGNNNPYRYIDPDGNSPVDVGFFFYDAFQFGKAVYKGEGIKEAAIDLGISTVGVFLPLPGLGEAAKAARAAEHVAEAARNSKRVSEGVRGAEEGGSQATKFHEHHADPKFMGGDPKQATTRLNDATHRNLHKDMNDFLRKREDAYGNHMRPQRGNSGSNIRQNFSREERLQALSDFYRGPGAKYKDAANDFFKQHPGLNK